jgi:hypothetical protein
MIKLKNSQIAATEKSCDNLWNLVVNSVFQLAIYN